MNQNLKVAENEVTEELYAWLWEGLSVTDRNQLSREELNDWIDAFGTEDERRVSAEYPVIIRSHYDAWQAAEWFSECWLGRTFLVWDIVRDNESDTWSIIHYGSETHVLDEAFVWKHRKETNILIRAIRAGQYDYMIRKVDSGHWFHPAQVASR